MNVLVLYDKSGPKYHRLLLPCFLMPGIELKVSNVIREDLLEGIDIVFFNRILSNVSLNKIIEWRDKYGFKLIVDFDDHWKLGPDHLLYHQYKQHDVSILMEEYIKICDSVTCTHERLANEIRPLNPNVHVLPNAIPYWGQFTNKKQPDDYTRLFWAGGITHKNDLELIRRPLQLIKRDNVKFVLGGYIDNPEWKAMAKLFTTDSSYNTEVLEALPVDQYYAMYSKCDIALIPLVANHFNSFKSNLKILEVANMGCPVVVSRVDPYLDFPEDIVNYVDLHNPWYLQIHKLLKEPEFRQVQGSKLRAYCAGKYNFIDINKRRKLLFDDTIQPGNTGNVQANVSQQVGVGEPG